MWWHMIQHWLAYQTGSEDMPGVPPHYNFWSGFGSDLEEITIVAGIVAVFKKHNCQIGWCWRIGHHRIKDPDTGIEYMLCRAHHPDHPGRSPVTPEAITAIHKKLGRENG